MMAALCMPMSVNDVDIEVFNGMFVSCMIKVAAADVTADHAVQAL